MTKKKPGAKRGAPKNNTNARKHGLYGKKFITDNSLTVEQKKAFIDYAIEKMFQKFKSLDDLDQMTKAMNSLSIGITASNNCERTLAILIGQITPLEEILNAFRFLDPAED